MKQYEQVYPDFCFLGAVPLNCDDLSFCSLYKLNFDQYKKDHIDKLGIVFNHDKYGSPGSHWVALFIDISGGKIYFCDSTGKKPIENINRDIDHFKEYYKKKHGKEPEYKYNTHSYQMDASECGVYSCNFLVRMLYGEPFDDIVKKSLNFSQINSCRNVYFSNQPSKYKPHPLCDPK
jgi:hypothetical protein